MRIEEHEFHGGDPCVRCGIPRPDYDDSPKPNPCRGFRNLKVPDDEPGTGAVPPATKVRGL